jgi:uncharacterized protein (TIGR03435 family)
MLTEGLLKSLMLMAAAGLVCGQSVQTTQPPAAQGEFDTVSIKPYVPQGPLSEGCTHHSDPVMLSRIGCTLEQLVEEAYDLKSYQIQVKGPAWIETDPYVIQARSVMPTAAPEMMRMLQLVLASRFHLSVHRASLQGSVYLLQVASHGLKLEPASVTKQCGRVDLRQGTLKSECLSMDDLAEALQEFVVKERPVVNRTDANKENRYKVSLDYSVSDDPAAGPSIFSALPDQLGLTLKAGKAPLDTLVIDRAERPQAN